MDDDNVERLDIKFKRPLPDGKFLTLVPSYTGCIEHSYVIDAEAEKVTCSKCEKVFNPMSVLVDLARKESRWMETSRRYKDEMKRLDEKQRTKCQHCQRMTRIK